MEDYLSRVGMDHSELGFCTSIINQENVLYACPQGNYVQDIFFTWGSCSPNKSSSCPIAMKLAIPLWMTVGKIF